MITVAKLNGMSSVAFLVAFGDVAEHSPWVAREAGSFRPFASRQAMIVAFEGALRAANRDAQLALIRAHPDLAAKARLTGSSAREQAGAGLDTLSAEEFARFTSFNDLYRERFGFPFIYAVKGATKHMVLESFEQRLSNDVPAEFKTAIAQICRIFRFRIEDRVSP